MGNKNIIKMEQKAQVEIFSAKLLHVYKWIRKNMDLGILEANCLAKKRIIDFNGDFKKALELYEYLKSYPESKTRLIIDVGCEIPQLPAANVYLEEDIIEDENFVNELEKQ